MKPDIPEVLTELAGLMARNAEPGVAEGERANALRLSAGVLGMAAEFWDGAAERLVRENRSLAELLGDSAAEEDLRLSALGAENARLRALLIAAHAAAEQAGDVARQEAIWAELVASTERRKLSTAPV
jgi:hypothetical protein